MTLITAKLTVVSLYLPVMANNSISETATIAGRHCRPLRLPTVQKALPYILIIASLIGLFASFQLTYDKIHVLQNPHYIPGCNLNPVISCGSVMKTKQAELLGVPNTIFGLAAFGALSMFGLMLAAGAKVGRWLWLGAQGMATLGVIFMHYLFFQGVFRIHAICPWCFAVWMVTIPTFWAITVYNLREGNIHFKNRRAQKLSIYIESHAIDFLILWYLVIFGILVMHFWYYWKTLL